MSNLKNEGSTTQGQPQTASTETPAKPATGPSVETVQAAAPAGTGAPIASTPVVAADAPVTPKYQFGGTPLAAPFMQAQPGDKVFADPVDMEGVDKNASQVYRDKYAEVMRTFQAGTLRSPLSHVITERSEARIIAADQARQFEAGKLTQPAK